jgi:TRAP-type C4-dicarboxylate transport system substrate-binding protein
MKCWKLPMRISSSFQPRVTLRRWLLLLNLAVFASMVGMSSAQAVVIKIATLSPPGSTEMKLLREGGAAVAERTEGRVEFKFYPGGVMGDDKAVLRKIRVGQLHGAVLTSGGLNQVYPDIELYSLPMIFNNLDEVDRIRQNMDGELMTGLRGKGYVGFGIAEVGFAYAMSKTPVLTVEEVRAQKVWIPVGDSGAELAVTAFGISPIPLSIADVLAGLQTGMINGVAIPPVGAIALQWHTQLKNVFDLPLLYVYGLLTIRDRQFDKLAEADQQVVSEVMSDVVAQVNTQNRKDHQRAVEALKAQGLRWSVPSAAEVSRWQSMADTASATMVAEGVISKALFETLQGHLADYRAQVD